MGLLVVLFVVLSGVALKLVFLEANWIGLFAVLLEVLSGVVLEWMVQAMSS